MGNMTGFYEKDDEMSTGFEVVPEGDYTACIVASEWKQTAKKTGKYLQFDFQLIEGEFKGQKVFLRLNLDNPNEMAVKISRATLACVRHATGVMSPDNSYDLHDIPMRIHVACKKRNDGVDEFTNEITKFEKEGATTKERSKEKAPW